MILGESSKCKGLSPLSAKGRGIRCLRLRSDPERTCMEWIVWHYSNYINCSLLPYICLVAKKTTSLSLTPLLETYELKGYTLVEVSCVIWTGSVIFKVEWTVQGELVWKAYLVMKCVASRATQPGDDTGYLVVFMTPIYIRPFYVFGLWCGFGTVG